MTAGPRRDASWEPDPGAEIQSLLDAARTALGMDVAFITALDGDDQVFTHMTAGADSFGWAPGVTIPAVDGYCQYVISGDIPNAIRLGVVIFRVIQVGRASSAVTGSAD